MEGGAEGLNQGLNQGLLSRLPLTHPGGQWGAAGQPLWWRESNSEPPPPPPCPTASRSHR